MRKEILLSIITINYNNENGLLQTINSIQKQKINKDYLNKYEYIVIDGFSNDTSIEIIKNSKVINKYLIERDEGIADAFNKGIDLSSGKYLYFLNSGDIFYENSTLSNIVKDIKTFDVDILINKIAMVDENKNIKNIAGKSINLKKQKYRKYLPHQGMLIKKDLFNRYGKYDINYRLGMDYEWSLRLLKDIDKLKIKFDDKVVCKMLEGGISQTRYKDSFIAYHKARVKNDIMNKNISYLISVFFIIKRSAGLWVRDLIK